MRVFVLYSAWTDANSFFLGPRYFADVLGFWKRPFESEDPSVGGCSALPVPSVEEVEAHLHESGGQLSVRQKQWRKFTSSLASGSHLS